MATQQPQAPGEDLIQSAIAQGKEILKDKKNKNAIAASTIAYYLSKGNKERNAIVAGILAYTFLPDTETEEK